MNFKKAYEILHWQLADIYTKSPPSTPAYIIIWNEQIPLGHVWWHGTSGADFFQRLKNAIKPTLQFYLAGKADEADLNNLLEETNISQLVSWLKQSVCIPHTANPISIIICTSNRSGDLQNCLESLHPFANNTTEIIVVDNAPVNELTKNVVSRFAGVRYIREKRKGLDIARNTGVRNASHDLIAFTDDDVIVPRNWVSNMAAAFYDPLTMAVTGIVLPGELSTEAQVFFEKEWGFNKGYLPRKFDHLYFLKHAKSGAPVWDIGAGANMAFRKQAFQLAGLFDERLDAGAAGCSGDSEMWFRILAAGWNCHYLPHIYVHHKHREFMDGLKDQIFNYMKGHAAALLIQHEKYPETGNRKRLYWQMPWFYAKRTIKKMMKLQNQDVFLTTEIKGCLAGRDFYLSHADQKQPTLDCIQQLQGLDIPANKQSKVSVIIPCYNQGHYLSEALASIAKQTHARWEIIVVDDGSDDATAEICKSFSPDLIYVRVERVGLAAARNIGAAYSTGDYLIFLDADDFLYPEAMEINLYFFNYYKDVVMVSGGHQRVDENKHDLPTITNKVTFKNNYASLLEGNYIAMEGAVMYRRNLFPCFHFDTKLGACEDYDLNLAIARHYPVFGHDRIVAAYRIHNNNMSHNKKKMLDSALAVLNKHKDLLTTQEELRAYQEGLKNWRDHYNQ